MSDRTRTPDPTVPILPPRFDEALLLASHLHRTQTRKGTAIPYLAHLLAVAARVLEHGGDEVQDWIGGEAMPEALTAG